MTISISNISGTFSPPAPAIRPGAAAAYALPQAAPPGPPPDQLAARRAQNLQDAAVEITEYFSTQRTDLKFQVDNDAGRVVVTVVDAEDGTVLRQIPGEDALRIARSLSRLRATLIEEVA